MEMAQLELSDTVIAKVKCKCMTLYKRRVTFFKYKYILLR